MDKHEEERRRAELERQEAERVRDEAGDRRDALEATRATAELERIAGVDFRFKEVALQRFARLRTRP